MRHVRAPVFSGWRRVGHRIGKAPVNHAIEQTALYSRAPNPVWREPSRRISRLYPLPNISLAAARRITPRVLLPFLDRIQHSAEGLRLARGMFWSTAGAVSSRSLSLLASIIVARVLGKSVFGELGIIQSTTNMFMTFAELGVGLTATKYVAEFRKKGPRARRTHHCDVHCRGCRERFCGGLDHGRDVSVGCASAGGAPSAVHHRHQCRGVVLDRDQRGAERRLERPRGVQEAVDRSISRGRREFSDHRIGVYFFGLIGAVYGLIASQVLVLLLNYQAIRKETSSAGISIRWREARKEMGILTSFSLPTLFAGAVYVPSMWIANMILVTTPGGYAEMGVFNAADRWRTAILFLPSLLGGVTLPMLASLRGEAASQKYHASALDQHQVERSRVICRCGAGCVVRSLDHGQLWTGV